MNVYLVSFLAGLMVGVIYYFIQVRSPAPPLVALVGLLGMVVGEAAVPRVRAFVAKSAPEAIGPQKEIPEDTK
jgi:XapX domain-containing protein